MVCIRRAAVRAGLIVGAGAAVFAAPSVTWAAPSAAACDGAAISADLGNQLNVVRCYQGWAYVSNGELGDATSLVRLVGTKWTAYAGFPSTICAARAASDGVPSPELRSFPTC